MFINDTMRLFLHSVDRDIEALIALDASDSLLNKLKGMQDNVRSQWAIIRSNDKKDIETDVTVYYTLNTDVNKVYNSIVTERLDDLNAKGIEGVEKVDEYILSELFLSYTIFLDAFSELGLYYVICSDYPFQSASFFMQQKMSRAARKIIADRDSEPKS
jgi:hypothetical protein